MRVEIGLNDSVEWSCVNAPTETPIGMVEVSLVQVRIGGHTYQFGPRAAGPSGEGPFEAFDVDTGETVELILHKPATDNRQQTEAMLRAERVVFWRLAFALLVIAGALSALMIAR